MGLTVSRGGLEQLEGRSRSTGRSRIDLVWEHDLAPGIQTAFSLQNKRPAALKGLQQDWNLIRTRGRRRKCRCRFRDAVCSQRMKDISPGAIHSDCHWKLREPRDTVIVRAADYILHASIVQKYEHIRCMYGARERESQSERENSNFGLGIGVWGERFDQGKSVNLGRVVSTRPTGLEVGQSTSSSMCTFLSASPFSFTPHELTVISDVTVLSLYQYVVVFGAVNSVFRVSF